MFVTTNPIATVKNTDTPNFGAAARNASTTPETPKTEENFFADIADRCGTWFKKALRIAFKNKKTPRKDGSYYQGQKLVAKKEATTAIKNTSHVTRQKLVAKKRRQRP